MDQGQLRVLCRDTVERKACEQGGLIDDTLERPLPFKAEILFVDEGLAAAIEHAQNPRPSGPVEEW